MLVTPKTEIPCAYKVRVNVNISGAKEFNEKILYLCTLALIVSNTYLCQT